MKIIAAKCILFIALLPAFARAECEFIAKDNSRLDALLAGQKADLTAFEKQLADTEAACQNEQKGLSLQGATAATAESCVALRENAVIQWKLTGSSEKCSASITKLKKAITAFKDERSEPFRDDMEKLMELHGAYGSELPECSGELAHAAGVKAESEAVLARSFAAIKTAKADIQDFEKLGGTTRGFAQKSDAAVLRCEGKAPLLATPEPLPALPSFVPRGTSPNDESTITGEIGKEKLGQPGGSAGHSRPKPEAREVGAAAPAASTVTSSPSSSSSPKSQEVVRYRGSLVHPNFNGSEKWLTGELSPQSANKHPSTLPASVGGVLWQAPKDPMKIEMELEGSVATSGRNRSPASLGGENSSSMDGARAEGGTTIFERVSKRYRRTELFRGAR